MKHFILLFVVLFFSSCTMKGNTNGTSDVSPQEAYSKGKAYFLAQNYSDALTWAKKAADGKYCPAYVLMAEIYESYGSPVDDPSTARYYYSLAVSCASKNTRDYWFSCWRLGYFYENGKGNVTKDLSKALYYYQQARTNTISTNASLFDQEIARVQQLIASTPQTKTDDKTKANNPNSLELQQSDDGRTVVMKNKKFSRFKKIVSIESFMSEGQKKYVVFAAYKNDDPNTVSGVHIVPKNNKNTELYLPLVTELIYHDLGPGKEFCSVKVRYWFKDAQGDYEHVYKDERIPDPVANQLIALLVGKSKYTDRTEIKVTETKSDALQPDEYKW